MKINNHLLSRFFLTVIFLVSIQVSVHSQGFNSVTSPDGVNVIAVGNSGKLYRSGNGGVSYAAYTVSGSPNLYSVTSFGNDVWYTGQNGNVYKTSASSISTTTVNSGTSVNLYSVFFIDANTGFVCGDAGNVYKTTDGGLTWSPSYGGITGGKLNSISFRDAGNGTIAANNGTIYKTTDGGLSWSTESSGTGSNLLKVKYFGSDIFATGEYGIVLKNTGSGWTNINTRTKNDVRGLAGSNVNDVHVCGGGGFIRNNKNGSSNFFNFEINPMLANLVDIFFYDINKGWAVSSLNGVIIYTVNGGSSWSMPAGSTVAFNWVSKWGTGNFLGNNLCQHPSNRNTFFAAFSNRIYVSRNRGENWSSVGNPYPAGRNTPHSFFVSPLDTNIWLVANEFLSTDKILRTTNYGTTWDTSLSKNFSNYGQPLEIDQNNPSVFYFAPDGGGFWKSTNSGDTFTEISGNYAFRSPCEILVTWDSSNIIILGDGTTGSGRAVIFKSVNGGVNWTPIDSVSNDGNETPSMCNTVFERNVIWSTEWNGSDIYKSTDFGSDFTLHHNTGFSGWGSDICREDPTMLITGSWGEAATISTNGGTNWTDINTGLDGHGGGILIAERGLVLAQQGSNLYKLNITYTDVPVLSNADAQSLSLGATGIQFYLSNTISPSGTVKNNNGVASASFNITRIISPGSYSSTKAVMNLASNSSANVIFDPWTFDAGTTYNVKDSVYLYDDVNPANDVLSGTITPYIGEALYKLNEAFAGTFPPTNWTFIYSDTNYWISSPVSGYQNGAGSAKYDFWNSPDSTIQSLVTENFDPSNTGDSIKFDHSYASYTNNAVDSLVIEISSNGGSSYTTLVRLHGGDSDTIGVGNTMKTVESSGSEFTPSSSGQWLTKSYILPAGTNKIKFRAISGYGNNLYIDNINVLSSNVFTQYNIKLAPQGMYNGVTLNLADTVKAYLRNSITPFNNVDSSSAVINSATLIAPFIFKNAPNGTYYLQLIHRNSLETWSKSGGESFTKGITTSFDFTSAQTQAYGNNMVLVGSKWCLYSGDVTKDGLVDLSDLLQVYNKATTFTTGYVVTDLTGEGTVDLTDILLAYNNSRNFVSKNTPETSLSDIAGNKEKAINSLIEYEKRNGSKKIELEINK